MKHIVKLLSSFFYLGYSPIAAGTVGSAVGCVLYLFLPKSPLPLALVIVGGFLVGVFLCSSAEEIYGRKDPPVIICDEIVGMWVALFLLPVSIPWVLSAFVLFRIFDVFKPYPAAKLEKTRGGWGVMLDDIVAAVYANLILQAFSLVIGR